MKKIAYINLEYVRSKVGIADGITGNNVDVLRNELNVEINKRIKTSSKIDLLVIDMYNYVAEYSDDFSNPNKNQNSNDYLGKKSNLYNLFKDVVNDDSIDSILFVTHLGDSFSGTYLINRDFPNSEKVLVASYVSEDKDKDKKVFTIERCKNVKDDVFEKISSFVFRDDLIVDPKERYLHFLSRLISNRIKTLLSENKCIKGIAKKDHILHSTPVHVNKYVNLKPILEKHDCFNEVCCLLYHQILRICGSVPDFVVASSRNSIYIASGLLRYFKTNSTDIETNMIIIDQISPVTRLTNFSNLDDIRPNRKYAIIEDFCCMGTEIKIVKSILWSRGVELENEDYPIHVFPVVSSNLYGNETNEKFQEGKIHPLHVLDNSDQSEKYLMFTSSCCPICNRIKCKHSKEFNFK